MISKRYVIQWRAKADWIADYQVEQDLVISRAILEIFSSEYLYNRLAFRGGTSLNKLFFKESARYSEDINLVQIKSEPIKETVRQLREKLSFLGMGELKQKESNNTLVFRYESEIPPIIPMKLKIEINCREHFNVLGLKSKKYSVDSEWFKGNGVIRTYPLEEILGTKLRALYQRKKGRDLFDLYKALILLKPDIDKMLLCYRKYMEFSVGKAPSKKDFVKNLTLKMNDRDFLNDVNGLIRNSDYNAKTAGEYIMKHLIEKM
jgi:predicted nucleotidyltransferase component of viral defense system